MSIAFRRSRFTPTPPGGTVPIGATELQFLDQDFATFQNDGLGNSGRIMQTYPLSGGPLARNLVVIFWFYDQHYKLTKAGVQPTAAIVAAVRDSTKQPNATLAQFIAASTGVKAALNPQFTFGLGAPETVDDSFATGNVPGGIITVPSMAAAYAVGDVVYRGKLLDDYGNTIAAGDSFVLDVGVVFNKAASNQAGTFSLTVLFSWFYT